MVHAVKGTNRTSSSLGFPFGLSFYSSTTLKSLIARDVLMVTPKLRPHRGSHWLPWPTDRQGESSLVLSPDERPSAAQTHSLLFSRQNQAWDPVSRHIIAPETSPARSVEAWDAFVQAPTSTLRTAASLSFYHVPVPRKLSTLPPDTPTSHITSLASPRELSFVSKGPSRWLFLLLSASYFHGDRKWIWRYWNEVSFYPTDMMIPKHCTARQSYSAYIWIYVLLHMVVLLL